MPDETKRKLTGKLQVDSVDVHIGNYLKKRRSFLGMTQQELAKNLKISFQQIQKYEKGTNRIFPRRLLELSAALKVPVQYFFENMKEYRSSSYPGLSEIYADYLYSDDKSELEELISSFTAINQPEARHQILGLVKMLAKIQTVALLKKEKNITISKA